MSEEIEAHCPKCGCAVEVSFGHHAAKWFGSHPATFCEYRDKKWLHCATKEEAILAVNADNSKWSPPSPEIIALVEQLISVELDKERREKRKGYTAG